MGTAPELTDDEARFRCLALAAAAQANEATAELLGCAREGPRGSFNSPFDVEVIEKLADATKMAIEAGAHAGGLDIDADTNQLLGALIRYLEGWAG
ncbi:hypothetical protein [Sphingomonas koreensis]|uniref:hypothetical protein n=1 Tax=Sphingomonas koreensis TaxID=93064 RepID=UPI000F7F07BF|nr:hypothetical protein [Sphingomonas koreensis]MDC7808825.1 hypothetical protein [Sphingomonas koreensis]RSU98964.1 hypothetical protein CA256_03270 [Sphingomonas koreensis]